MNNMDLLEAIGDIDEARLARSEEGVPMKKRSWIRSIAEVAAVLVLLVGLVTAVVWLRQNQSQDYAAAPVDMTAEVTPITAENMEVVYSKIILHAYVDANTPDTIETVYTLKRPEGAVLRAWYLSTAIMGGEDVLVESGEGNSAYDPNQEPAFADNESYQNWLYNDEYYTLTQWAAGSAPADTPVAVLANVEQYEVIELETGPVLKVGTRMVDPYGEIDRNTYYYWFDGQYYFELSSPSDALTQEQALEMIRTNYAVEDTAVLTEEVDSYWNVIECGSEDILDASITDLGDGKWEVNLEVSLHQSTTDELRARVTLSLVDGEYTEITGAYQGTDNPNFGSRFDYGILQGTSATDYMKVALFAASYWEETENVRIINAEDNLVEAYIVRMGEHDVYEVLLKDPVSGEVVMRYYYWTDATYLYAMEVSPEVAEEDYTRVVTDYRYHGRIYD